MKIVHVQPNSKRKIKTLPVTGNYLIPESGGNFRWAEPNESWRLYAHTGQKRCFITNIRYDDTEHSPDLWLYSVLKSDEMRSIQTTSELLMENNRFYLDRSRKWYIRQFVENTDRVGVRRFTGLPLNAWRVMWRQNISFDDIEIYGLSNNSMKILYAGLNFNAFLKWPELQKDTAASNTILTQAGVQWKVSTIVMPWLEKNCKGGFYPFSDYDAMMPDDMDEVTYTIDMAELS